MAEKFMHPCRQAGCPNLTRDTYCEQHRTNNDAQRDEIDWMYQRPPWTGVNGFQKTAIRRNPACQRIIDGKQCGRQSVIVHHIISPRTDLSLFLVWSNVVCLCRKCHPTREDSPHWIVNVDYTPTNGTFHV